MGAFVAQFISDLVRILGGLMKRADKLDAIIVETGELADPAPVADIFVDQDVADRTKLDAIVTGLADAVHLDSQLGEHHEAEEQIAFADIVLLNKTDLVGDEGLERVESVFAKLTLTKITRTSRCVAPLDEILGLDAFSFGARSRV